MWFVVRRGASASPAGLVGVRASCLRGEVAGRDLEARAARRAASDRAKEREDGGLFFGTPCAGGRSPRQQGRP